MAQVCKGECNHEKGKCECLCFCSISKIGCVYCILPVLGYRQIKKILRKRENTDKKFKVKKIAMYS